MKKALSIVVSIAFLFMACSKKSEVSAPTEKEAEINVHEDAAPAVAGVWKPYPGAKVDEETTNAANEAATAANRTNVRTTIYTTPDSFSKVASFYAKIAQEYLMPMASGTTGEPKKFEEHDLYEAYFIFDGAKDLAGSKLWVKVQRPHIGLDVRDVTAILLSETKE
ncbi:MAG TPA: hypothetical protein PLP83_05590 [Candidatus Aminicenantes bacterium]|nr:hypothetical protein [Candidatus Aminicenantes bacterium]